MASTEFNPVAYMIDRSLHFLLGDASEVLAEGAAGARGVSTPIAVGIRLISASDSGEFLFRPVAHLVHAARCLEIGIREFIPACRCDAPLTASRRRITRGMNEPGVIDWARTFSSGVLTRGQVVHIITAREADPALQGELMTAVREVSLYAARVLEELPTALLDTNPLVRLLSDRVRILRRELLERAMALNLIGNPKQRADTRTITHAQRRFRSIRGARELCELVSSSQSHIAPGTGLIAMGRSRESRLYEFWCFAEFTRALFATGRHEVAQHSLLRRSSLLDNSPVFELGESTYVYFEHRGWRFRAFDGRTRTTTRHREEPERGAEWMILPGFDPDRAVIIDCKRYKRTKANVRDGLKAYLNDYNALCGVLFISAPTTRRPPHGCASWEQRKIIRYANAAGHGRTLFQCHLVPDRSLERENAKMLAKLVELVGL